MARIIKFPVDRSNDEWAHKRPRRFTTSRDTAEEIVDRWSLENCRRSVTLVARDNRACYTCEKIIAIKPHRDYWRIFFAYNVERVITISINHDNENKLIGNSIQYFL